ncbi:choice-of-anchor D domain-containing protein [Actinospica sp.]|uniref:choice-of-anchor D domain-containing protein n=1 Tax=Actinospica sp. TaxID=1872142 RepID=UPI002B928F85|nr:choice-of-anchor D domain-containing protein [Actinospica sp.]HWG26464.1 choice-of-anchor D domain-containing protein [Actinospica sp.]
MSQIIRRLRRAVALTGGVALLASGLAAATISVADAAVAGTTSSTATTAAASAGSTATGGSGANLPYVEVEAESEPTNGTVIGPSYTQGQLADEASGRKAVTLQGAGQYVTFTTPIATNSIDFRYSIPDTSTGAVYTAPLSLYVNGTKQTDFSLTNAYSWYYGTYPFTNTPGTKAHHFFDETHRRFTTTYPAGTAFRLQVDSEDTASSYTIDLADFQNVAAPLAQPAGSVSVTSEGADPTGVTDATSAFNAAITAAGSGGTVWIPAGTYNVPAHIIVNNVTVEGAGMWYSTVTGTAPGFYGNGTPTNTLAASTNVHLSNFAIFGDVQQRVDSAQVNGIGGAMSNSTVSDIWIEHEKVGAWMDGPMTNLTFSGMRIRDTTADGINLHGSVTSSTITNSNIRNTGDDGLALWSDSAIGADSQDTISDNTVQLQQLANGIAAYGGNDNTISGNLVVDTGINEGGGITVAQRFTSTPVGLYTVENNTLIRDGDLDDNWQFGDGALWFDAQQATIAGPINVSNALIEQSPFEAIQWIQGTVNGVDLSNVSIIGTGTFALQDQTGASVSFTNVTATDVAQANLGNSPSYTCDSGSFKITDDGGNSGILPATCTTTKPTPVYPPYPGSTVQVSPGSLSFGSVVTGSTSAAQSVSVSNPTSSAASVSSISVSGDFAETNNCGSSIAANGSCTASVTFSPTATGSRSGTLTVNAGGETNTVTLSGTGTASGPVLSTNPASLTFPSTTVGNKAATQSVSVTNTGTASATISGVTVSGDYSQTNTCGSLAVNASCTVTVTFTPTATGSRTGTLTVTGNANNSPTKVGLTGTGASNAPTNLALKAAITASTHTQNYVATNADDGNTSTYWESTDGAWPSTLTVNLGATHALNSVVVDLPPSTAWQTRTQTFSILGSTNNSTWTTLAASATYTFNPSTGNTVTVSLPSGTSEQYVELGFTANSVQNGAQVSELDVTGL